MLKPVFDIQRQAVIILHIRLHILGGMMKRTNVILTDEQHKMLKSLARKGGRTLGELVREAVDAAYAKRDTLEQRKAAAIDSYREGFISLGKLADALGIDTVTARLYLRERGIAVNVQDASEITSDAANA